MKEIQGPNGRLRGFTRLIGSEGAIRNHEDPSGRN